MLELSPSDPIIKTYLKDLQHLKSQQVTHELGLKGPFQNLLDKAAKKRGWTLVHIRQRHGFWRKSATTGPPQWITGSGWIALT